MFWPRFRNWGKTAGQQSPPWPAGWCHVLSVPLSWLLVFSQLTVYLLPLQRRTVPTSDISTQARARRSLNSPLRRVSLQETRERVVHGDSVARWSPGVTGFPAPDEKHPWPGAVEQPPPHSVTNGSIPLQVPRAYSTRLVKELFLGSSKFRQEHVSLHSPGEAAVSGAKKMEQVIAVLEKVRGWNWVPTCPGTVKSLGFYKSHPGS